jgi:hypothetical protein
VFNAWDWNIGTHVDKENTLIGVMDRIERDIREM